MQRDQRPTVEFGVDTYAWSYLTIYAQGFIELENIQCATSMASVASSYVCSPQHADQMRRTMQRASVAVMRMQAELPMHVQKVRAVQVTLTRKAVRSSCLTNLFPPLRLGCHAYFDRWLLFVFNLRQLVE